MIVLTASIFSICKFWGMTSFWRHYDVISGFGTNDVTVTSFLVKKKLKKIMEIAELKSFISYAGFFLLSLLEKKLQRFSIFKNNPGRIDPPLPIFLGPRFLGHPIPDFGRVFCIRTGLNSCSLAKKAGSEIAGFSEKIRKILGGGSVRPPHPLGMGNPNLPTDSWYMPPVNRNRQILDGRQFLIAEIYNRS